MNMCIITAHAASNRVRGELAPVLNRLLRSLFLERSSIDVPEMAL